MTHPRIHFAVGTARLWPWCGTESPDNLISHLRYWLELPEAWKCKRCVRAMAQFEKTSRFKKGQP